MPVQKRPRNFSPADYGLRDDGFNWEIDRHGTYRKLTENHLRYLGFRQEGIPAEKAALLAGYAGEFEDGVANNVLRASAHTAEKHCRQVLNEWREFAGVGEGPQVGDFDAVQKKIWNAWNTAIDDNKADDSKKWGETFANAVKLAGGGGGDGRSYDTQDLKGLVNQLPPKFREVMCDMLGIETSTAKIIELHPVE